MVEIRGCNQTIRHAAGDHFIVSQAGGPNLLDEHVSRVSLALLSLPKTDNNTWRRDINMRRSFRTRSQEGTSAANGMNLGTSRRPATLQLLRDAVFEQLKER